MSWASRKRTRLIERDGPYCHYCGCLVFDGVDPDGRIPPGHVEHKVPRSRGGSNSIENLVLSCRPCDNLKGDTDYEVFYRRSDLRVRRRANFRLRPLVPHVPPPATDQQESA